MELRSGDKTPSPTVEELLTLHRGQIRTFLTRRSGPAVLRRTTVDDLFQETAKAAMSSADSFTYQDDARFLSWITTIARRVISQSLRGPKGAGPFLRIRRSGSTGTGVGQSNLLSLVGTPSSAAAGRERMTALYAAMSKLPEHYQEVLRLYKLEERPLGEVAEHLGKTKGATCRLLARATEALRESLGA